jgi:GT2 family glycosyltransferase
MNDAAVPPVLSIVIVTWNGKRYALECLESLHARPTEVPVEIIVVDNASTDGTPEAIRTRFPSSPGEIRISGALPKRITSEWK